MTFYLAFFFGIGIKLINFKIVFGRYWEDEQVRILLADEITPDSCRLWDLETNKKLEKTVSVRNGTVSKRLSRNCRAAGCVTGF